MRASVIFIIIILILVILFFLGWARIPDMIANNLSSKLKVAVSIDKMGFRPSKIDVDQLEIGNPRGYSLPKAFSAKEIDLYAPLTHYFKEEVVVDEIDVRDVYLGLEFDSPSSTDGNWTKIMSNFGESAHLEESGKGVRKVFIKKIVFSNIDTDLLFRSSGNIQKLPRINRIELTNISTEGGFPTDQLMATILGQMLREVFLQHRLNNMLEGILNTPGDAIDTFLKPFKGVFNATPKEEVEDIRSA